MRFQILVVIEAAAALQQSETARVVVLEGAEPQSGRIIQWPPDPLAVAGRHQQTVRIMHLRAEIVEEPVIQRTVIKHAGQRATPNFCTLSRKNRLALTSIWVATPGLITKR